MEILSNLRRFFLKPIKSCFSIVALWRVFTFHHTNNFFLLCPLSIVLFCKTSAFLLKKFLSALLWSWQAHCRIDRLWLASCTIKYIVHVFFDAVLASLQCSIRVIFREQRPLKLKVLCKIDDFISSWPLIRSCRSHSTLHCVDIDSGLASGYLECKIRLIHRVDEVHFSSRFTVIQAKRPTELLFSLLVL